LYSVYTIFLSVANLKEVNPSQDLVGNNSSVLISNFVAQIHNVSNASNLPKHTAWCHRIYPSLSMASNNFFL